MGLEDFKGEVLPAAADDGGAVPSKSEQKHPEVSSRGEKLASVRPLTLKSLGHQPKSGNVNPGDHHRNLVGVGGGGGGIMERHDEGDGGEHSPLGEGTADLENVPLEEVFKKLRCTREGLTSQEAEFRIKLVGPNKLEEQKENLILKFLMFMWNPLSWVMELAALMALAMDNGDHLLPDWQDFVGIICLLLINSTVSYIEETNAGQAAAALMQALAPKAKVLRDRVYKEEDASVNCYLWHAS